MVYMHYRSQTSQHIYYRNTGQSRKHAITGTTGSTTTFFELLLVLLKAEISNYRLILQHVEIKRPKYRKYRKHWNQNPPEYGLFFSTFIYLYIQPVNIQWVLLSLSASPTLGKGIKPEPPELLEPPQHPKTQLVACKIGISQNQSIYNNGIVSTYMSSIFECWNWIK